MGVGAAAGSTVVEDLRRAVEDFADAVASTAPSGLRGRVASCPGWSAYDLVVHLGNVHGWAATIVETAIDITLLGRYYERFADHAVSVARRVVYLVTGERHVPEAAS